jgi:hypothetical protein
MRRLKRIALWFLGFLFAAFFLLIMNEIVIFVVSDELSARKMAEVTFIDECARRGVDTKVFDGPLSSKGEMGSFTFTWINPVNRDRIIVATNYLPFGTEAWFWRGKDLP